MTARGRFSAALIALALSQPVEAEEDLRSATSEKFSVGQVWKYKVREGESGARVHVGKIEAIRDHVIIRVKLTGLEIKVAGSVGSVVGHAPIAEDALARSVTEVSSEPADLEGFADGYSGWREAFDAGNAGWFTHSLAEVVAMIEQG